MKDVNTEQVRSRQLNKRLGRRHPKTQGRLRSAPKAIDYASTLFLLVSISPFYNNWLLNPVSSIDFVSCKDSEN